MDEKGAREVTRSLAARMAPVPQPVESLTTDARLIEDLGYDSLHLMMLIIEVLDTLAIEIPGPEDIEQFEGLEFVRQLEDLAARLLLENENAA